MLAGSLYAVSGNIYTCARIEGDILEAGEGHFNRYPDEGFYDEFARDLDYLDFDLQEKKPKGKTVVPIAVYVHIGLKSYFDDANNSDDGNLWAKEVRNALAGLDMYKDYGIEFEVKRVRATETAAEFEENGYACLFHPDYKDREIAIAFYPMNGRLGKEQDLGRAYVEGNYAEVYLSNNETYNKIITAHEMGHIFGLRHDEDISSWAALYDPFRIFSGHLMRQHLQSQDLTLSENDEEILEKAKERFRR